MDLLPCGHAAYEGRLRTCLHLVVEDPPEPYRMLTGTGLEYDLLCADCVEYDDPHSQLAVVCEGCAERADEEESAGWRGTPEIRHRDAPLDGTWAEADSAVEPMNDRCLAPLPGGWLAFTTRGLVEIGPDGSRRARHRLKPAKEPPSERSYGVRGPTLHTSGDGRFAAVVNDYGRYGVVVDLGRGGAVTLRLDREDYHADTVPFPLTFLGDGSVVAATAWNRLDRFDAATGRLLSERDTAWAAGQPRPDYYLDYFHGRLTANRAGTWCLDDGWVWHPVGVPQVIDLAAWCHGDTFAAERGRDLAHRAYAWNQPVAWVDDATVAVQRIGDDDLAMLEGVQLYDAATARRVGAFAGPSGRMWSVGGRLALAAEAGLELWDPAEEARVGLLRGFHPTAFDDRTGTFAELTAGRLRTWRVG